MTADSKPPASPPPPSPENSDLKKFEVQEVRYSLPEMLRELQLERTHSYFAKEIIDQVEITRIFAQARARRAKSK
jgi:hypothetical protein